MRRKLVARVAPGARASIGRLLLQVLDLQDEAIDLLLLAVDDEVQFVHQVFGKARLRLQGVEAGGCVVRLFHAGIEPQFRCAAGPVAGPNGDGLIRLSAPPPESSMTTPDTAASLALKLKWISQQFARDLPNLAPA